MLCFGNDLVFCPLARGSPVLTGEKNPSPEDKNRAADSPTTSTTLIFSHVKRFHCIECANPTLSLSVLGEMELLCLGPTSPVDLLCGPVPSCLPSPQLRPDPVQVQLADLIHFETHSHSHSEQEPVYDRQPQSIRDHYELPESQTSSTDSPGRRAARNKVKLAANFSFTAARPV